MESEGAEQLQEGEEESQDSQELDEIPVQLDESYETLGITNSSNIVRGKYYKQTYRPAWEQMPDFKGWLRGVVGEPTRAYCTYCQKTLHAHRLSLLKHTCTIRHQKAAQIHNTRKSKAQGGMEQQEIHAVVLQDEEDMIQTEIDNEQETIEYAETNSEADDDQRDEDHDLVEEEDEEQTLELHQVPFEKHNQNFQANQNFQTNQLKPPVSTHIIDTTRGSPVSGLQVSLYKLIDGRWTYINEGLTNVNGRFSGFVDRGDFTPGRYKLHYDVDRYFEVRKQDTIYPFIEVVFDCRSTTENYHIPILLSPFGYSTYRGS